MACLGERGIFNEIRAQKDEIAGLKDEIRPTENERQPMKRKIVQIAVTSGGTDNTCDTLYALTDTGDLYLLFNATTEPRWRKLPEIDFVGLALEPKGNQ